MARRTSVSFGLPATALTGDADSSRSWRRSMSRSRFSLSPQRRRCDSLVIRPSRVKPSGMRRINASALLASSC